MVVRVRVIKYRASKMLQARFTIFAFCKFLHDECVQACSPSSKSLHFQYPLSAPVLEDADEPSAGHELGKTTSAYFADSVYTWACGDKGDQQQDITSSDVLIGWIILLVRADVSTYIKSSAENNVAFFMPWIAFFPKRWTYEKCAIHAMFGEQPQTACDGVK